MASATATAYLGPPGTFSEEAALLHAGADAALTPVASFPAVVAAVERGEAADGVLPIENSLEGQVTPVLDLLIHQTRLKIKAEVVVPVRHVLAGAPGATLDGITLVTSHPQGLGQCRRFLDQRLPNAEQVAALSTAGAVAEVATGGDPTRAAIGPPRAVERYGAIVLARDIQDADGNETRFVVLGAEDAPPSGRDKTSLGFTVKANVPGALLEILVVFADQGLQMTKVESRPTKGGLGKYVFLVDLEGHRRDPAVAGALALVEERCATLWIFGSYPRFSPPAS